MYGTDTDVMVEIDTRTLIAYVADLDGHAVTEFTLIGARSGKVEDLLGELMDHIEGGALGDDRTLALSVNEYATEASTNPCVSVFDGTLVSTYFTNN